MINLLFLLENIDFSEAFSKFWPVLYLCVQTFKFIFTMGVQTVALAAVTANQFEAK